MKRMKVSQNGVASGLFLLLVLNTKTVSISSMLKTSSISRSLKLLRKEKSVARANSLTLTTTTLRIQNNTIEKLGTRKPKTTLKTLIQLWRQLDSVRLRSLTRANM